MRNEYYGTQFRVLKVQLMSFFNLVFSFQELNYPVMFMKRSSENSEKQENIAML